MDEKKARRGGRKGGGMGMGRKGRKQAFTKGPMAIKGAAAKPGKKKTSGHSFGNLFGATPKKPEADAPPRTTAANRANRMKRLEKQFI